MVSRKEIPKGFRSWPGLSKLITASMMCSSSGGNVCNASLQTEEMAPLRSLSGYWSNARQWNTKLLLYGGGMK